MCQGAKFVGKWHHVVVVQVELHKTVLKSILGLRYRVRYKKIKNVQELSRSCPGLKTGL